MYYLLMPTPEDRTRFIAHLAAHNIKAVFHYLPLHLSEYAARWGGRQGDCPVTEDISERLVRLPFYSSMDNRTQQTVIDAMLQFSV
jgi:dTDP-4-amino-4,6-dideoxygalactose transaminase